ncbi:MAG TPA: hypothetical protein VMV04_08670 [Thermodesulfobacteriota bacterium]|nr:hypothetical protein [Thermodesulfobacteriota bacterium]
MLHQEDPGGNTSNALECGLFGIGWIADDFAKSEALQRQRAVLLNIL